MTKPLSLAEFTRIAPIAAPAAPRATVRAGLSAAIDDVAGSAAEGHGFLRYAWYAAALAAYGGHARTIVVERA